MTYYAIKKLTVPFDQAVARVEEALKREGFGILSDIDIQQTLKNRLDVDFKRYRILGACHPAFAYQALQAEDKIGLMLPCNVVVQEDGDNGVEVAAIDPIASMLAVDNEALHAIARQVRERLKAAMLRL